MQNAGGSVVCYLDHDDEYYPHYLELVARNSDRGDVLVFGYDFVYEDAHAGRRPPTWNPARLRQHFFVDAIVTPLGVAHRRQLWQKVGGFNELVSGIEDWDFWKRMARAGAEFLFIPLKIGLYHVRADSISRMPRITRRQREMYLENWHKGRPMYEDGTCVIGSPHPNPLPVGEGRKGGALRDLECGNSLPLFSAVDAVLAEKQNAGLPLAFRQYKAAPLQVQSGCELPHSKKATRKVAFVSPHCILDFTNGAATATLDGLALLARSGFQCQVFCSSRMDSWEEVLVEEVLARRGVRYAVRKAEIGEFRGRMIFTRYGNIPVTLFNSASTRGGWINADEIAAFLSACEIFLTKNRPDVVWTYGGDPVSLAVQKLVKGLDIPILFGLHNFAYRDAQAFQMADYVVVPTEFCRQFYWETLGLASLKLPLVVDPARVCADGWSANVYVVSDGDGTKGSPHPNPLPAVEGTISSPHPSPLPKGEGTVYVTFVNPEPRKGIHVFTRIAEVLLHRRPDISLLLVEGASKARFLPKLGIDLSDLKNLRIVPNSPDARGFHAMTKMLLIPSLAENAGLVAMEAMLNGIPVLASNRGGLPETIGDAGFLLDIPAKYTPETREVPTAEEVEPWVETIIRLWDDPAEYASRSEAARQRAQEWHPDRLAPIYREFFGRLTHQPGPPLVPK